MGIYDLTLAEKLILFCVFMIGVIVGRVFTAIQVGLMKKVVLKKHHKKDNQFSGT